MLTAYATEVAVTPDPGGRAASSDAVPPLRILCVDDNHDVADSSVDLLRIVGFDARASYSGEEALSEVAAYHPSVCLIDLNMPGMDGDELAAKLRSQASGVPLVLVAVTAMSDEKSTRRIEEAGFDLHLVKPVDPCSLISIVDRLYQTWTDAMKGQSRAEG